MAVFVSKNELLDRLLDAGMGHDESAAQFCKGILKRVCMVSVRTMEIVDDMAYWDDEGKPVALGDREKRRQA